MAETAYSKFRLGDLTLGDLDALAASAGNRSQALREAVAYWRRVVEDAAHQNASDLDAEDWTRLAQLNHPNPTPETSDSSRRWDVIDWSHRLALELATMFEGRALILPAHKTEAAECRKLAKRIAGWGHVRGYALMSALRHFWEHQDADQRNWWHPRVWMTAEAK